MDLEKFVSDVLGAAFDANAMDEFELQALGVSCGILVETTYATAG